MLPFDRNVSRFVYLASSEGRSLQVISNEDAAKAINILPNPSKSNPTFGVGENLGMPDVHFNCRASAGLYPYAGVALWVETPHL